MKHHIIKISLAVFIIAAVVVGVVYWPWPEIERQQDWAQHVTSIDNGLSKATSSFLESLPTPSGGPSPAEAILPTQWRPEKLIDTLLRGEERFIAIAFTPRTDLPSTVVRMTSNLQPYVDVDPKQIDALQNGQTTLLNVLITVPVDFPGRALTGVLYLADHSSRPVSRPLPLVLLVKKGKETSFIEQGGRYALAIPASLKFEFNDEHKVLVLTSREDREGSILISIDANPLGLAVEDYYDGEPGPNLFGQSRGEFSLIDVAGVTGYRFEPAETLGGDIVVVVPTRDAFIMLHDFGAGFQSTGVFQSIIDSLVLGG